MSVLSSDLDPGEKKMAPVAKTLPIENSVPSPRKALSATPTYNNGETQSKKCSLAKRKNFFKRALSSDKLLLPDNRKNANENNKTLLESNGSPRVEIINKDLPEENGNYTDSNGVELAPETPLFTKTFEMDDSERLRPDSLYHSAGVSDDESSPLSPPDTPDKNRMSVMSLASNVSHSERVVQEIVATEQTYVKDLEEIIKGYLKNMRSKKSPFTKQELADLFMNIEEIHKFNKGFLEELDMCGDDPVQVALCFVANEKGFDIYTDYCTKYPQSMEVLTECTTKKETASFLQQMQVKLNHALPLGSYLLKPVQRILKYRLLLQDIKKRFDKENDQEGYDIIVEALSVMTDVAHYINEMKRKHEAAVHVQEVQSQLTDFEGPDLTTYGKLVLEDLFRMQGTRTDRYLFLFEKILLITKKRESNFSCKFTIKCDNMMMTESVPKEPLGFQVIRFDNQKINYAFLARNMEQKRKWMLELKRLIVESLAARVPMRAKALILGEKNVEEGNSDLRPASKLSAYLQLFGCEHVIVKACIVEPKLAELIPCINCEHLVSCICQDKPDFMNKTLIRQEDEGSTCYEASFLSVYSPPPHGGRDSLTLRRRSSADVFTNLNTDSVSREEITVIQFISCEVIKTTSSNEFVNEGSPSGIQRDSTIEEKKENEEEQVSSDNKDVLSKSPDDDTKSANTDSIPLSPGPNDAPVSIRVEDWERKSLVEDKENGDKQAPTESVNSRRSSSGSTREYLLEDIHGVILGRAESSEQLFSPPYEDSIAVESTEKVKTKTMTGGGTLPRRRSADPVGPEGLRNKSWTGGERIDDKREDMKKLGKHGLVRVRPEGPWVPKRSSSLKHLRAHLAGSTSDLTSIGSDSDGYHSESVFDEPIDRCLSDIVDNSTIKQTVREVRRAFSFSDSTTASKKPGHPHAHAHTLPTTKPRHVIQTVSQSTDFDNEPESSPTRVEDSPTERPASRTLEDLLASIDRDLDETRDTISKAQLLECALRVRREGRAQSSIPEDDHEDDIGRHRLAPVRELLQSWKVAESSTQRAALAREMIASKPEINSNAMSKSVALQRDRDVEDEVVSKTKVGGYNVTITKKDDVRRNMDNQHVLKTNVKKENSLNKPVKLTSSAVHVKAERIKPRKAFVAQSVPDSDILDENDNVKPRLLSRNEKKPVVMELKDEEKNETDGYTRLCQEETRTVHLKLRDKSDKKLVHHRKLTESPFRASADITSPAHSVKTAAQEQNKQTEFGEITEETKLKSVHKMARQYSKRISEDRQVRDIRTRLIDGQRTRALLNSSNNNKDTTKIHASPEIKIKRVTKVRFDDKTLQSMTVVRRRRKPGSRRAYRASYSFEKARSELSNTTEEPKDRPRSADLSAPFEFIEESDDYAEMPFISEELERDEAIARGVVRQLISKFDGGM